jgi:thiol-disulfide isomerase/thioredoxin
VQAWRRIPFPLILLLCLACTTRPAEEDLLGTWRAVLASPGGELPFTLRVEPSGTGVEAVALNGEEEAQFSSVRRQGDEVVLEMAWFDSRIRARFAGADRLEGEWSRTHAGGTLARLPFTAARGDDRRFLPEPSGPPGDAGAVPSVEGTWEVTFTDDGGSEPAQGEFRQEGERVLGTFLTPTGDHRFLDGDYRRGVLRLSTFDGSHAYLFVARAQGDGTLAGDWWSRDAYHATWTARRAAPGESALPDPASQVRVTSADGRLHFSFPDLEGRPLSLNDPRFAGKVVIVSLFGSWCPNCADEAPLLVTWHRRWRDRGLEMLGLAYEYTGDPERDREFVARHRDRHRIEYPLALAGTSDKAQASTTLPDLSAVLAFPTTIFIGRDGTVRHIHSGFAGPGTGEHYAQLVAELEALIERLLDEQP